MMYEPLQFVKFPEARDINVNMMPIVFGDRATYVFDQYADMIDSLPLDQKGEVVYLTINESWVPAGHTQRRGGIHTDGYVKAHGGTPDAAPGHGGGRRSHGGRPTPHGGPAKPHRHVHGGRPPMRHGAGNIHGGKVDGGIFLASTDGATRIWNKESWEGFDYGDCEHLRESLGEGSRVESNRMYWITDRTVHESLALARGHYRQFFRIVGKDVDEWFAKHNTPSPCGVQPGGKVVHGSKFE